MKLSKFLIEPCQKRSGKTFCENNSKKAETSKLKILSQMFDKVLNTSLTFRFKI